MSGEIDKLEPSALLKPEAIPAESVRQKLVAANAEAVVEPAIKKVSDMLKSKGLVSESTILDEISSESAAEEYVALMWVQEYVGMRMWQIRQAAFGTIDSRGIDSFEEPEEWMLDAPVGNLPGSVVAESTGVVFQRTAGKPKNPQVDEAAFKAAHPRMHKSLQKEVVVPATAETRITVFDTEAFLKKAESNKELNKFIKKAYNSPKFLVKSYNG